jgi:hypothetical protein
MAELNKLSIAYINQSTLMSLPSPSGGLGNQCFIFPQRQRKIKWKKHRKKVTGECFQVKLRIDESSEIRAAYLFPKLTGFRTTRAGLYSMRRYLIVRIYLSELLSLIREAQKSAKPFSIKSTMI